MRRFTRCFTILLPLVLLFLAVPASAEYGTTAGPSPQEVGSQAPSPLSIGNDVVYWHDTQGNVLGIGPMGQVAWLEMPAGYVHVGAGEVMSGYGLDYTLNMVNYVAWDVYEYNNSSLLPLTFKSNVAGSLVYPGALIIEPLTVRVKVDLVGRDVRLKNVIRWTPKTRDVTHTMAWRNLSTDTFAIFAPKYFCDLDANVPPGEEVEWPDNTFGRSRSGVVAWSDPTQVVSMNDPSYVVTLTKKGAAPFATEVYPFPEMGPPLFLTDFEFPQGEIPAFGLSVTGDYTTGISLYHAEPGTLVPGERHRDVLIFSVR